MHSPICAEIYQKWVKTLLVHSVQAISDQTLADYKLCCHKRDTTGIKIKMKERKVEKEEGRER